jgi:DNA-binding response OmpR family regulator
MGLLATLCTIPRTHFAAEQAMATNLQSYSVLIVDSGASGRQLHEYLSSLGVKRFLMGETPEIVLSLIKANRPNLVAVGADLIGAERLEIAKQIRRSLDDPYRRTPILVISTQVEDQKRSRTVGANHFLLKPYSMVDLTKAVELVLRDRREFIISKRYVGPNARHRIHDYSGPDRREARVE